MSNFADDAMRPFSVGISMGTQPPPPTTPPLRWGCVVHRAVEGDCRCDIRNAAGTHWWNGKEWSTNNLQYGWAFTTDEAITAFNQTCTTPPPDWTEPKPAIDAPPAWTWWENRLSHCMWFINGDGVLMSVWRDDKPQASSLVPADLDRDYQRLDPSTCPAHPKPAEFNGVPVGTCWRDDAIGSKWPSIDRWRLRPDGRIEVVGKSGGIDLSGSTLDEMVLWETTSRHNHHRCADEPLNPTSPLRDIVDRIRKAPDVRYADAILQTYTLEVEIAAYRKCLDKLGGER